MCPWRQFYDPELSLSFLGTMRQQSSHLHTLVMMYSYFLCLGLKPGRESNFGIRTSESLDHGKPFLLLCGMYPGFCYSNENSYHIRTRKCWDHALSSTRCFCCDGGLTRSCARCRCHHYEVVRYRSLRA